VAANFKYLWLDLAVANQNDSTVTILLGQGGGVFKAAKSSPITLAASPTSVVTSDFNGDGKLDLAVTSMWGETVSILLGNGDGTFTSAIGSPISVGSYPGLMAVGNFGGKPSLAVANLYSSNVTILLGNGDGTFAQTSVSPTTGADPEMIVVGDFNGDGIPDLAIANAEGNNVTVLIGQGNGVFAPGVNIAVGHSPGPLTVGDFNGDGILDLAVANLADNTVSILKGDGTGAFSALVNPVSVGTSPEWILASDLNGDGTPELAVANGGNNNVTVLQPNQTKTTTITGVPPFSTASQNVEVSYSGDSNYSTSTSAIVPLSTALIAEITPSSGLPGTFVNIIGANFGLNVSGSSSVTFNGVSAQVTNWTPTTIQAIAPVESTTAPAGVTTGPVVVTTSNPSGVSNAVLFTVPTGPTITGLSPVIGSVGTSVTISGFNFGSLPSAGTVTFNRVPASPTSWGSESIIVPVPVGATTGPVVVNVAGVTGNSYTFTVSASIAGISPTQGNAGTVVTISGTGFGSTQGSVTFNGVPAIPANWSNTSIVVPVPTGA
jgi:hypothetical protein